MEIWKDVVGYEGIYEVSNLGRIRTKEGKTTYTEYHGIRVWKSRIIKNKNEKSAYGYVDLWKEGSLKTTYVHRIVAEAFIENPNNYETVNHKDGNPRNNNVENLEWCTIKMNIEHAYDTDLNSLNKKVILRNESTGELLVFRSMSRASEYLGKSKNYLSKIISRKKEVEGYEVFIRLTDWYCESD